MDSRAQFEEYCINHCIADLSKADITGAYRSMQTKKLWRI